MHLVMYVKPCTNLNVFENFSREASAVSIGKRNPVMILFKPRSSVETCISEGRFYSFIESEIYILTVRENFI